MKSETKDKMVFFLIGFALGISIIAFSWGGLRKTAKKIKDVNFREVGKNALVNMGQWTHKRRQVIEDFSKPVKAVSGKSFGKNGQLTFELYRNGIFLIDGKSGYAWQRNVWGHGMPNPVFMVYFDRDNKLVSYDGKGNEWQSDWMKAVAYEQNKWYRVEIEKTKRQYIMSVCSDAGKLLKSASVNLEKVWNADEYHKDYFVIGDPHENYYQGSMKIKEIAVSQN
ncbi:MAG: hypothetical protein HY210_07445 [Candidatus Omnitrophica bacterium]|nr:hypothetical protein [Candidatus Omnitrophota bacterium]